MYNITTPENCSSNCYDSIFYSLLKYYNFDYEAYNLKYIYTDYYDNTIRLIHRGNYSLNILKDFFGIDLNFINRNQSNNIYDIICNSINNNPVGIIIDPYYCHWSPFYKSANYFHMLLIIDIDYYNKKYICFDTHYTELGYIKVDFDVIENNFINYFIIDFKKSSEIRSKLILDKIDNLINNFDYNIDSKKSFILDYFTTSDRKILFQNDIKTSIMLINIMWIAEDKKNSQLLFRYIEKKINYFDFTTIYELLSISEQKFTLLKSILIRYAITNVLKVDSLKSLIDEIYDTDLHMVNQLENILGGKV